MKCSFFSMKFFLLPAVILATISPASAQMLDFKRVFSEPALNGPTAGRLGFSPDGSSIVFLRSNDKDVAITDLWAADVKTGQARLLLAYEDVATGADLSEAEKARRERQRIRTSGIVEYSWPEGRSDLLLVPVDGRLLVVGLGGDAPSVAELTDDSTFETDARFSPNAELVSYVRGRALYIQPRTSKTAIAFSPAATETISYGMAEFIAQEEMDRDTGYWWSPNSQFIAYTMVDEAPVDIIQRPEIDAGAATLIAQRYPRAGTANARVRLFVAPVEDPGRYVEVDLGPDPDSYLARVTWLQDSSGLLVQRQTRDQKTLDVLEADVATGKTRRLWQERSQTWVNLHNDLYVLKDDTGFVWASERDGFQHLYLLGRAGQVVRAITSGDWQVDRLHGVDEETGTVYFSGRKDGALEKHVYAVSLKTDEAPQRITTPGFWNEADIALDFGSALINRSSPSQPPQVGLFSMQGDLIRWIEENKLDETHPYAAFLEDHVAPEYGSLTRPDGTARDYALYLPPGDGPVPAILNVYGGPGVQLVRRDWGSLVTQVYARTFAVMQLDNRGSSGRGKAFEDPIYKALGSPEVDDQKLALEFLAQHPRIQADSIGVEGWSYGGYMTLKLLMQASDLVAAGVSGAPVTLWELYDTHYTERYLGDPAEDNGAIYAKANVFDDLDGLKDPLLLIHGMADDNVLLEHSTRLLEALQQRGVIFESMLYPGQKHGFRGQAIRQHVEEMTLDFFKRTLIKP